MTALGRPVARGTRGAVACGHPLATDAALEVFRRGGGAVDAAVAAAAALSVVLPEACGLGGDALFLVRQPSGEVQAFNGSGRSPARFAGPVPRDGAGTAAVPGLVAALEDAQRQYGHMAWNRLWEPAVRLATDGFPAGEWLVGALDRHRERLARGASGWEVLAQPVAIGTIVRQRSLGVLLRRIAAEGAPAFYLGPVAEAIACTAAREGGALTAHDLSAHDTVRRASIVSRFRGAIVHAQPPVSQAIFALMALKELDGVEDLNRELRVHVGVEAIEAAFQHRAELNTPGAEQALLNAPLLVDHALARRRGGPTMPSHTTAVATADSDGVVVSMVISVFGEFGCATLVPEGGFFLNDRMLGFTDGLALRNGAAASKRPVHTLSPLLVEQDKRAFAAATPGADGQVQTLTQVLDAMLAEGSGITAALDRRRWRSVGGTLVVEEGFEPDVAEALAGRGHDVAWAQGSAHPFGAAVVAGVDQRHGGVFAAADLRREAWAGAY